MTVPAKQWAAAINQYDLHWVSVNVEPKSNGSQVEQHYRIRQTPTLYVFDHEGRIASKGIFGPELESFLLKLLRARQ